ncbi:MAG: glycosyltransferase [Spirochaetota bacterium]
MNKTPKTLIVYDFLQFIGGAEYVVLHMLKSSFPDAKLLVAFKNRGLKLQIPDNKIICLGYKPKYNRFAFLKVLWLFFCNRKKLKEYDCIIVHGIWAPFCLLFSSKKYFFYCHTPPRFSNDLFSYYWQHFGIFKKIALYAKSVIVNFYYNRVLAKAEFVLANSKNVQGRIKKYCKVDSQVLYPPIKIHSFQEYPKENYYISFARLEREKRIPYIIEAFQLCPEKNLLICSDGSKRKELQRLAQGCKNIKFVGEVTDEKLYCLIGKAIASIYIPIDEDFGMSPVESMALGVPVIGVNSGGLRETILHNRTGWLCEEPLDIRKLIQAIYVLTPIKAKRFKKYCLQQAEKFTNSRFDTEIQRICSI